MRRPLQTIQELYAAFGRRDTATIFSLFSPDIEIRQSEALPWGGLYRGHAGAQQFFAKLTSQINSTVAIDRFIDAGDHVVVVGWTQGAVNGTGATFRVPIAHVWKVRDGLAEQAQFFIDNPTMLAALDANSRSDGPGGAT